MSLSKAKENGYLHKKPNSQPFVITYSWVVGTFLQNTPDFPLLRIATLDPLKATPPPLVQAWVTLPIFISVTLYEHVLERFFGINGLLLTN